MQIDRPTKDDSAGDLEPKVPFSVDSEMDVASVCRPSGLSDIDMTPTSPNWSSDHRSLTDKTKSVELNEETLSLSRGSLEATLDVSRDPKAGHLSEDSHPVKEKFNMTNQKSAVIGEY